MNTFVQAIDEQTTLTENGAVTRVTSADKVVDLFYQIGASRGKNIIPSFVAAYAQNPELALRVALWARDVRGGAGERKIFRDILQYLENTSPEDVMKLLTKIPDLGRFDDLFVFKTQQMKNAAYTLFGDALRSGNQLAGKWAPREGSKNDKIAKEIMKFFGMTPKEYRKGLVALSKTVEQQMCAKEWEAINFSHVPSVAAARYRKAFYKNAEASYKKYVESLVKKDNPEVKVNASAVYPHTIIQTLFNRVGQVSSSSTELDFITAQWEALPNYVGDSSVLSIVDVSGSMGVPVGGQGNVTCMQVAISLGLYTADKNKGAFKDCFMTFSSVPKLQKLKGNIVQKMQQMSSSEWGMSTSIENAFSTILDVAVKNAVKAEDMPKTLLIMSDMQFNQCIRADETAHEMIRNKYSAAGYDLPNVVFWNLHASNGVPVKFNQSKTALVSGFSPTILESVLSSEDLNPETVMLKTVMKDRYSF